jgi:hypothetical protein
VSITIYRSVLCYGMNSDSEVVGHHLLVYLNEGMYSPLYPFVLKDCASQPLMYCVAFSPFEPFEHGESLRWPLDPHSM